jgi:hypothetical protein
MNPAGGDAPGSTSWEPWPLRSKAKAVFLLGEQTAAERLAVRFFQRRIETWEYAGLAGAPDGAVVEIGVLGGKLYVELRDPSTAAYRAHFIVTRAAGKIALINDGFHIPCRSMQGRGFGLQVFHRQVANARALGFRRIDTVAGRRCNENGYYTWPRYGFDGALPFRLRRKLPVEMEEARSVLDLMECEKGRSWWRVFGETLRVSFDLFEGSRSLLFLSEYVRSKTKMQNGPKRNLETSFAVL